MILNSEKYRVNFDVNNSTHVEEYKYFLQNSKWKSPCRFNLEAPFESIPHMIQHKLIRHLLKV